MTRSEDKAKELLYVEDMIRLLPQLGVVGTPIGRERPDFGLLLSGSRSVGLEVVRAVDEGIAADRGAKKKMKERVTAGMRAAGMSAHINFSISDGAAGVLATKTNKAQLAAEIEALVKLAKKALSEHAIGDKPWRRYQWFDDIFDEGGNVCWQDPDRSNGSHDLKGSGVEFCNTVMVRPYEEPLATASGTSLGQSASIIQDAIDEKAGLLSEYRTSDYEEQWLLVVGSAIEGGTLDISDAKGEFTNSFDRTFFLERFSGECVALKIQR